MIDLHSHAFQRALAGLTQRLGADAASFWTWRDVMYAFAAKITPEDQRAIAAQLYLELLKGGYTLGGRVPLPAPSARRPLIRRAGGDVARDPRGGRRGRHRPRPCCPWSTCRREWTAARLRARSDASRSTRTAGCGSTNRLERSFADDPDRQLGLAVHSVRAVPRRQSPPRWRRRGRDPAPCRCISTSPSSPGRSTTALSASAGGHGRC